MTRRWRNVVPCMVGVFPLLIGCAQTPQISIVASQPTESNPVDTVPDSAPSTTSDSEPATTTTVPAAPIDSATIDLELDEVVDVGRDRLPSPADQLVAAAIADIERWTEEVLTEVYDVDGSPLRGEIYAGHPDRIDPIPGCGEPTTDYQDLIEYVALYCPGDEFVVYDDGPDGLLGSLVADNGGISIGVVVAHEFGHFIQDRAGLLDLDLPTVVTEQHADCLAGAWLGRAVSGDSPLISVGGSGIRAGLIALVQVRDPAGIDTLSPGGHGTAFDRVGAFQTGIDEGAEACVDLIDNPLPLMPNEFLTYDDYLRGGDASYDCLGDSNPECRPSWAFLGDDLNEFWSLLLGESIVLEARPVDSVRGACTDVRTINDLIGRCPGSGTVVFDSDAVLDVYLSTGDFTLGYLLGLAWVDAILDDAGTSAVTEPLLANCLVGSWVDDITIGERRSPARESTAAASPGDPDEAIMMLIWLAEGDDGTALFERVASFRSGVLGGFDACVPPQ